MALPNLRRVENVQGNFYVDSSCIDCDLCRQIAPRSFRADGEQSIVYRQPETPDDEFQALKALVTCPTASIGTMSKLSAARAAASYPELVYENVYFCGYASESSFGASSYLIVRESGNVLVDSPRYARPLARRIRELGGVRWMFLTHRDDVADHDSWAREFGAERIIHESDAGRIRQRIERLLSGASPQKLDSELTAIPTPGHTQGHTVLLYRDRFLFSGDHVWWSPRFQGLNASRSVNWYSWPGQVQSLRLLQDYEFEWVLPGHGRRVYAPVPEMQRMLDECIRRLQ